MENIQGENSQENYTSFQEAKGYISTSRGSNKDRVLSDLKLKQSIRDSTGIKQKQKRHATSINARNAALADRNRARTEQHIRNFKEEDVEPVVSFGLLNRYKVSAEQ